MAQQHRSLYVLFLFERGEEAFDVVPKIGTTATIRNMAVSPFFPLKGYWSDPPPPSGVKVMGLYNVGNTYYVYTHTHTSSFTLKSVWTRFIYIYTYVVYIRCRGIIVPVVLYI